MNWSKIDSAVAIKIFNYKELSHMLLGYENGADGCVCANVYYRERNISVTSVVELSVRESTVSRF